MISKCQFSANIVLQEGEEVPHLQHQVNVIGAKPPFNFLTFDISPPGKTCTIVYTCTKITAVCLSARACVRPGFQRRSLDLDSFVAILSHGTGWKQWRRCLRERLHATTLLTCSIGSWVDVRGESKIDTYAYTIYHSTSRRAIRGNITSSLLCIVIDQQ